MEISGGYSRIVAIWVERVGVVLTLGLNIWLFGAALWTQRTRLRVADVIVLYEEGGFGHTVIGPDGMRRLFKGKKSLMIFFYQPDRHNPHVANIWPDIDVLMLPLWQGFGDRFTRALFVWRRRAARLAAQMLLYLLKRIWPDKILLSFEDYCARLPEKELILSSNNPHRSNESTRYLALRQAISAPALRLPQQERERIRKRINEYIGPTNSASGRMACLYLRNKGDPVHAPDSFSRTGSDIEDYLLTIESLTANGFYVALTGDREMPRSMRERYRGVLIDAVSVDVEPQLFQLYAATEADIFIGEAGGGSWISPINNIPSLIVNAFPYLHAQPGATLLYKMLRTTSGDLVPYSRLFGELLFDSVCADYSLLNNTPTQIRDAAIEFLDFTGKGIKPAISPDILRHFPCDAWIRFMDARISPAWLQLYDAVAPCTYSVGAH